MKCQSMSNSGGVVEVRRWRWGDGDGDWWKGEENISLEKAWMSSESPSVPECPLYTSVSSSHGGDFNSWRNRTSVRSPLPSTQKHLSPHTGHMPCNTSPLSSPSPVSLSCLFLFLSPWCCLWWSAEGWQTHLHGFMGTLSPSATVLYKHLLKRTQRRDLLYCSHEIATLNLPSNCHR